jgi:hypothetical protein
MTNAKGSPGGQTRASRRARFKLGQHATTTMPSDAVGDYWLHVDRDGTETRFEREPNCAHLTVKIVEVGNGRLVEQTWTRTIKVRGEHDKYFITSRPKGRGWKLHQWPEPETLYSSAVWRRPPSRGWKKLDDAQSYPYRGKVWLRPHRKGGGS